MYFVEILIEIRTWNAMIESCLTSTEFPFPCSSKNFKTLPPALKFMEWKLIGLPTYTL